MRCQVISLGDARSYYLSTAKNEFGVIFARSEAGNFFFFLLLLLIFTLSLFFQKKKNK